MNNTKKMIAATIVLLILAAITVGTLLLPKLNKKADPSDEQENANLQNEQKNQEPAPPEKEEQKKTEPLPEENEATEPRSPIPFKEIAGYDEERVTKIMLTDGSSGKVTELTNPEEIQDFFQMFDGIHVHFQEEGNWNGYTIGVRLYAGNEELKGFSFGETSLKISNGQTEKLYTTDREMKITENIRKKYNFQPRKE